MSCCHRQKNYLAKSVGYLKENFAFITFGLKVCSLQRALDAVLQFLFLPLLVIANLVSVKWFLQE